MLAGAPLTPARLTIGPRLLLVCLGAALALFALPTAPDSHARGGPRLDRVERGIVREVNRIRAAAGLRRLRSNRALARSADYHCSDMLRADFFDHPSSNGQSFAQRVESYRPSRRVGETLAYLPIADPDRSARRIVDLWMNSPPHRASLLSPGFRRIGVARRTGALGKLRAVVFTADLASAH